MNHETQTLKIIKHTQSNYLMNSNQILSKESLHLLQKQCFREQKGFLRQQHQESELNPTSSCHCWEPRNNLQERRIQLLLCKDDYANQGDATEIDPKPEEITIWERVIQHDISGSLLHMRVGENIIDTQIGLNDNTYRVMKNRNQSNNDTAINMDIDIDSSILNIEETSSNENIRGLEGVDVLSSIHINKSYPIYDETFTSDNFINRLSINNELETHDLEGNLKSNLESNLESNKDSSIITINISDFGDANIITYKNTSNFPTSNSLEYIPNNGNNSISSKRKLSSGTKCQDSIDTIYKSKRAKRREKCSDANIKNSGRNTSSNSNNDLRFQSYDLQFPIFNTQTRFKPRNLY